MNFAVTLKGAVGQVSRGRCAIAPLFAAWEAGFAASGHPYLKGSRPDVHCAATGVMEMGAPGEERP